MAASKQFGTVTFGHLYRLHLISREPSKVHALSTSAQLTRVIDYLQVLCIREKEVKMKKKEAEAATSSIKYQQDRYIGLRG